MSNIDGIRTCRLSLYESEVKRLKEMPGTLAGHITAAIEGFSDADCGFFTPGVGHLVTVEIGLSDSTWRRLQSFWSNDGAGEAVQKYLRTGGE